MACILHTSQSNDPFKSMLCTYGYMSLYLDLHCEKVFTGRIHTVLNKSHAHLRTLILWKELPSKPMAWWLEGDIFPSGVACVEAKLQQFPAYLPTINFMVYVFLSLVTFYFQTWHVCLGFFFLFARLFSKQDFL